MGVINKFKDFIGLEEYEEEFDDYEEDDTQTPSYYDRSYDRSYDRGSTSSALTSGTASGRYNTANVVSMQEKRVKAITSAFKLVVIEPQGFEECSSLVDSLKARKPIIVNLEKLEPDTARKIFDFLGGATYALNGNVQKVANNIFIFAPENVAIAADSEHQPYNFSDSNEDYDQWK